MGWVSHAPSQSHSRFSVIPITLTPRERTASTSRHIAIVLGIGLGVVSLIIMCLLLTIFINRRDRRPAPKPKPKGSDSNDKLRKLDAVSPACTLEEWWSKAKGPLPSSTETAETAGGEDQFVCVVCLESVLKCDQVRELKCLHVFHKECLEKWYLQDHFNCPLCYRAYYFQETHPSNDFVWMV